MNIDFQTITGNKVGQSLEGTGTESRVSPRPYSGKTDSVNGSAYVAQLDGSMFTDNAYAQPQRTADKVSELAQNTDVWMQHNYMALLSNTMSEEDYAKASEDGFDIRNRDSAETVTILDKIKSVLLESGTKVAGFNDDLSVEKLAKITGSRSFANALNNSFNQNDIPVTVQNIREAKVAYEEVSDIQGLDDDAVKYLVQNDMSPTIENIYLSSHSTNGVNATGRGFYAQETDGYFAMKAETFDWEQLEPQIDRILKEAGFDPEQEKEAKDEAKWIVQQGIPLTADTLTKVHDIKCISYPVSEELAAEAIAAAISDNKKATAANLADPRSDYFKAYELKQATDRISDDDIRTAIKADKELNLKNLINESVRNAQDVTNISQVNISADDKRFVEARLQLEEVRLRMTVEANKQLISSGFSIDTAPMQELIERLKGVLGQMSDEAAGKALDEITEVTPKNSGYIMRATLSSISIIKSGPIGVTGAMLDDIETASFISIKDTSVSLAMKYKRAGEEYETMMTKPRGDLGDNIKKAFRNADDILEDLGYEKNEDNRRAVRILGYNSMEIDKENLEKVKGWDQMLKVTLDRLKPGAVLDLIRDGKNPLGMTIEELAGELDNNLMKNDEHSGHGSKSDEKYSKFIYKLEHMGEISQEEKSSFIGIYRLFHTLKANDYQAIGSVLKTGKEMTLGNLLGATRTQMAARRGMEYTVDDDFGGLDARESVSGLKIDEQIQMAFRFYSAKADIVYENLEPEKLLGAKPTNETLLTELADELQDAGTDEALEKEFYAQETRHIREVVSGKEADTAFGELRSMEAMTTFNNLEAMISNRRARRTEGIWKDFDKEQKLLVDALEEDVYEDVYKQTLEAMSDHMQEVLESEADSYLDIRAISLMQKQLSVMSSSAERGTFDVPVEIDGQKISMHITLKSEEGMDSRMEASIQTYEYGLITATLYEKNGMISGMLTTTYSKSSEETEYLEGVRSKMCAKLAEKLKEFGVGQEQIAILYHAQSQPTSVGQTNANATDGNSKNITETRQLLTMAKAFIESL
ncbi:MAG: hypothetical protein II842_07430 [Butyrivibrio sp.]|nr:hypothetical protein [Butyrivibrio sp.]